MAKKYKIGYTTGVYDMFHIGHLNILRRAKEQCETLVVGVTTDELCYKRKQKYPIINEQERMAIVIDPKDVDKMMAYAAEENLEAVEVAVVTEEPRLVLIWRGKEIVNLSRAFLDTNGAHQETSVSVEMPDENKKYFGDEPIEFSEYWKKFGTELDSK